MIVDELLRQLLLELENKQKLGESGQWSEKQFEELSEAILKSTGTAISVKTLKRITGKIRYTHNDSQNYNPQLATKDALSQYLGYDSWSAFVKLYAGEEEVLKEENKEHKAKTFVPKKVFSIIFTLLVITVIGIFFVFPFFDKKTQYAVLICENKEGNAPHNAIFSYALSDKPDNFEIDYQDIYNLTLGNYDLVKPDSIEGKTTYTYLMPDVYYPCIKYKGEKLAQDTILVRSDKWLANLCYVNKDKQYSYKILNKINFVDSSGIYISPDKIVDGNVEINGYFTEYRWFDNFNFSADNLKLEFEFKNSAEKGGEHCQDAILIVKCKKGIIKIKLLKEGCTQWAELTAGKKSKLGNKEDMRHFGVINDQWQRLTCRIENQNLIAEIDGINLDRLKEIGELGEIYGFIIIFKGSGAIRKLGFYDLENKTLFEQNFVKTNIQLN